MAPLPRPSCSRCRRTSTSCCERRRRVRPPSKSRRRSSSEGSHPTMATLRSLVAALAMVPLWAQPSASQTPPPKNESELVAAGHKRLTAAQLRQKFIGNTSYVLQVAPVPGAPAGIVFMLYYKSDRERVVKPASGGGPKYTAIWWFEGDLVCAEERPPAPPGHRCYSFYEVEVGRYVCRQPDGLCAAVARTVPGNPENL